MFVFIPRSIPPVRFWLAETDMAEIFIPAVIYMSICLLTTYISEFSMTKKAIGCAYLFPLKILDIFESIYKISYS